MTTITYQEFERVNLRSGMLIKVEEFPRARKPALKVWKDLEPEISILQTSAQMTMHLHACIRSHRYSERIN